LSSVIQYDFNLCSVECTQGQRPDKFSPEDGLPAPSFVVARDRDCRPLSLYQHNVWNWTYYTPHNTEFILDFEMLRLPNSNIDSDAIIAEAKLIIFAITWVYKGRELGPTTTITYLRLMKRMLEKGANQIGLLNALGNDAFVRKFNQEDTGFYITTLLALYNKLRGVPPSLISIDLIKKKLMNKLSAKSQSYYKNHRQHPPIPSRIYFEILKNSGDFIEEVTSVLPSLLAFTKEIKSNKFYGVSKKRQSEIYKDIGVPPNERVWYDDMETAISNQKPKLRCFLEEVYPCSKKTGFQSLIMDIFLAVKVTLLAYTGARHVEVANLREDCLSTKVVDGKTVYIITGITSKLNNNKAKKGVWVTNEKAAEAVSVACKLSSVLYELSGENSKNRLLMPMSLCYGDPKKVKGNKGVLDPQPLNANLTETSFRNSILKLVITEEDIQELEMIDPFRAWRRESDFAVGENWGFTAHQLRRSLALYASKSGLVTLPSLRRQLQHLTEAMSAYYTNGNASAIDILGGSSDFIDEYNVTRPESEAASYVKNVLLTDERLFGAHGTWINKKEGERKTIYLGDRVKLLEQFKNRKMAYQDTILGGCTTTKPCKEKAMRNLVACLGCSGSIIKLDRIEGVISSQMAVLQKLDKDSIEYRFESADLDSMVKYRERIKEKVSK